MSGERPSLSTSFRRKGDGPFKALAARSARQANLPRAPGGQGAKMASVFAENFKRYQSGIGTGGWGNPYMPQAQGEIAPWKPRFTTPPSSSYASRNRAMGFRTPPSSPFSRGGRIVGLSPLGKGTLAALAAAMAAALAEAALEEALMEWNDDWEKSDGMTDEQAGDLLENWYRRMYLMGFTFVSQCAGPNAPSNAYYPGNAKVAYPGTTACETQRTDMINPFYNPTHATQGIPGLNGTDWFSWNGTVHRTHIDDIRYDSQSRQVLLAPEMGIFPWLSFRMQPASDQSARLRTVHPFAAVSFVPQNQVHNKNRPRPFTLSWSPPAPPATPKPTAPAEPYRPSRPGRNEKEKKWNGKKWVPVAANAVNFLTESWDMLDALYNALPEWVRKAVWKENDGFVTPADMIEALWEHSNNIDFSDALFNALMNEIGDRMAGYSRREFRAFVQSEQGGQLIGEAMQPVNGIRPTVGEVADAIWDGFISGMAGGQ